MTVSEQKVSELSTQLSQFLSEFFKELDRDGMKITEFYTEDGVFCVGGNTFAGHEAIKGFYDSRLAQVRAAGADAVRTARHTYVNLRISNVSEDSATLDFINLTYTGDGNPPILGLLGPSVVSDCHLECVRESKGKWLVKSFEGEAVFIGSDPLMNKMALKE